MGFYVVTGGAGFIGSHLVEELLRQGHTVIVLDDLSNGSLDNLPNDENLQFYNLDISRDVFPRLQGVDGIFHLACFPRSLSFTNPQRDVDVNIKGMVNVLEGIALPNRCKVVFTSNSGIYGSCRVKEKPITLDSPLNPTTPYDVGKLASEWLLHTYHLQYDLPYTVLRLATVYGPRQKVTEDWKPVVAEFIIKALKGEPLTIYGDGYQTRDFIYVKDVVRALILAMDKHIDEGRFLIASFTSWSLNELVRIIQSAVGKKLEVRREHERKGDVKYMSYSEEFLGVDRMVLGWSPLFNLKEGIRETVKWYRGRQNAI